MKRKSFFTTAICMSIALAGCNRATSNAAQASQTDTAPQQLSIVDVAEDAAEHYCGYSIANRVSDNDIREPMRKTAEEKLRAVRSTIAANGYSSKVASVTTMIGDDATRAVFDNEANLATAPSKPPNERAKFLVELCSRQIRSNNKYVNLINTNL